jgi:hypothetical protein
MDKDEAIVLGIVGAIAIGAMGLTIPKAYKETRYQNNFVQKLQQYADTNRDGVISSDEVDAFNRSWLKGKGVTFISGVPPQELRYASGKEVGLEARTDWLRVYPPVAEAELACREDEIKER